ncbi:FkbM family methyltransferase [Tropicibacter naphthalenivorans]|uniref:31-O-demethyl-FK506 methyltransferase FkbM n=1 Tax=Tropicibacter naphthalenivorans TaxID=441103 RepID=A0A0P1GQF4_9RHOB|nr:FkbM family methyltransferase [Tropicibacter naphthalenivorans]CUH77970.1 31-O-demethyl-FK506 methyltransferase FkbM [Tropicibacter naphthalenivorans]SMC94447.1 methyltransferase, FkbM family [Tropicibacter naphthalenivorans]
MTMQTGPLVPASTPFGRCKSSLAFRLRSHPLYRGYRTKLRRQSQSSFLWRLRAWLVRHPMVIDKSWNGLYLRLYPGENTCDFMITMDAPHDAPDQIGLAAESLATGGAYVDIGANVGLFVLLARQEMPSGAPIIAIEPHPRTLEKLRCNLAFNEANDVQVVAAAVGDTEGTAKLWSVAEENAGQNSILRELADDDAAAVEVPLRPLTAILAEAGVTRIAALKIDVEGFECAALLPFFEQADRTLYPRYVMIEIAHAHLWPQDLIGYLQGLGYAVAMRNETDVHLMLDAARAPETRTGAVA